MSSGKSHDPLQSYIDDLLFDNLLGNSALSDTHSHIEKLAAGSNISPLPSASRPARAAPVRQFAEPIRTINLRMPLPPVASAPVKEIAPVAPVDETEQLVDAKQIVEAKQIVKTEEIVTTDKIAKTEQIIESKQRVETQHVAEAKPQIQNKAPLDCAPTELTPSQTSPVAPAESITETSLAVMAPPPAWLSNGRPQWAQRPFECLIFKAGGLQLAAPLVELGSIYPLEEDALTEIFGQTQWFMGLLPVKEYNVRAMDTALVVMPERYNAAMRSNYRYVVSLFGSDWGLAIDAVVGTVVLDPEHIRWRGERSKRPWLAGTLIEQMCALFDIAQLAWLFHNQDRKRAPRSH